MQVNRRASCQQLLGKDPVRYGWLRKKDIFHEKFNLKIMNAIKWPKMFAVLDTYCLYLYSSEMSSKPDKFYALYPFTGVNEWNVDKESQAPMWSFALINETSHKSRNLIFAASSKKDMKDWMRALEMQMKEAREKSVIVSDQQQEEESSDDEEDYEKIEEEKRIAHISNTLSRAVKNVFSKSKSESTPPLPAPRADSQSDAPQLPGRRVLPAPPAPEKTVTAKTPPVVAPRPTSKLPPDARPVLPPAPKPEIKPKPQSKKASRTLSLTESSDSWNERSREERTDPVGAEEPPRSADRNESDYEVVSRMGDDQMITAAMWTKGATEGHEFISSCKENGVYLLRESTAGDGLSMTLVCSVNRNAKKFKIRFEDEGSSRCTLMVNEPVYSDCLSELIKFYMKNYLPCQGQQIMLTKPYSAL